MSDTTTEPFNVLDWSRNIIEGTGGMDCYESREMVVWHESDRVSAAYWTLKCLANPDCEGSDRVLEAIMEQRRLSAQEL